MAALEKILSRSKSNTTKKQKEKKDKNTSKKKEILYKDNTSGITYYSDGSTSKIKKEAPKKEVLFKDTSTGKKYTKGNFSTTRAKAKKDMTSNKAYPLPFGETFRQAKARGDKTFRWKNKQYHTKTKDELEKAKAGPKESKTYLMKQETGMLAKAEPKKKSIVGKLNEKIRSFRKKTTGYATQSEYEDAKAKRRIEKRISKMKERKNQGKNYSAKNLAELQEKIKGM